MSICKIRLFVRREEEKRKLAARNRRAQDTEDSDSGWLCPTFCGDNKFSMIPNIKRWNLTFVDWPGAAGFDREQELAATKIQSRIRGKHARPCKEDLFIIFSKSALSSRGSPSLLSFQWSCVMLTARDM